MWQAFEREGKGRERNARGARGWRESPYSLAPKTPSPFLFKSLQGRLGHPHSQTLVTLASPSHITLAIWVSVRATGDTQNAGMPISLWHYLFQWSIYVCIVIFAVVLSLLVCLFVCLFIYLFIYYSFIRFGRLGYLHYWQRREISLSTKTLALLRKASRQKLTRVGWSWSNYLPYKMNCDLRKILSINDNSFIYFKMFVTK